MGRLLGIRMPDRVTGFDAPLLDIACGLAEDGTFARLAASTGDPVEQLQRIVLADATPPARVGPLRIVA